MEYTLWDMGNDFAELSNEIGKFNIQLCNTLNIPYEKGAANPFVISLDVIQQCLLSATAYIRSFMGYQEELGGDEFLKRLRLGIDDEKLEAIIYRFPTDALILMIHFQIDSCFSELCSSPENSTFGKKMEEVLEATILDDKEDAENTLWCLAYIRNSFHNKGIHFMYQKQWKRGEPARDGEVDRIFLCDGQQISFNHNKTIKYHPKTTYLLIKRSVEVLINIIEAHFKDYSSSS